MVTGAMSHSSRQHQKAAAACAACRVSPGACPLRSGLFTRSQLPSGFNLVATIPRGACNINVTEMAPSANHIAVRTHRDGRYVVNGGAAWGSVDKPREYPVAGTFILYSYDGALPGGGMRGEAIWAPGPLSESLDVMLAVKHNNPGIQYEYHLPFSAPSKDMFPGGLQTSALLSAPRNSGETGDEQVAWRVAGLTPCSEPCGGGEQQTVLACMRGLHATLPPSHCDGLPQPDDVTMRCNTKPCPAQWEEGEWGPCSATCGNGLQTRPLICRQHISPTLTIKVADGACLSEPPERSRRCHSRPCPEETKWNVSEWSPCSRDCGKGVRTRRVWCTGDQGVEFPDVRCSALERPNHEEQCDAGSCATNLWFFTEWSQHCSSRCGPGVQRRQLHCSGGGGNTVLPEDETHCDTREKPADTKPCHGECSPTWFHGPWEQCPEMCEVDGPAHQTRSVVCVQWVRGQMKVVNDNRCAGLERPTSRRVCPHQPVICEAIWVFSTWSQCTGGCGNGHRSREVRCVDQQLLTTSHECVESLKPVAMETCEPEHCTGGGGKHDKHRTHSNVVPTTPSPIIGVSSCGPDKMRNCALVVQARLCQYPYYRRACCSACAKHDAE